MRGEKRLVILKEKEGEKLIFFFKNNKTINKKKTTTKDIPKKIKKKSLTLTRLKKPRDFLSPIVCFKFHFQILTNKQLKVNKSK